MTPTDVLDTLEKGRTLPSGGPIEGLSRAYFERVYHSFASDTPRAASMARHWKRVIALGDDPSYVYRAKGLAEWAQGKWNRAAESFLEAGRLQADGTHSFAVMAVDSFGRAGKIERALETAESLRNRLAADAVQSARLAINLANVLEQADRLSEALVQYQSAAQTIEEAEGYEADLAKALAGASACAWQLGDTLTAREAGSRAHAIFTGLGFESFADVCLANLAQSAFMEGRLDEAAASLTDLRSRAEGARRPWLSELLGFVYRRLNLIPEAVDCFEEALLLEGSQRVGRANLLAGYGLSLCELGQDEAAKRPLRQARRIYASLANRLMPAFIDLDLCQLRASRGKYREAMRLGSQAASRFGEHQVEGSFLQARYAVAEASLRLGVEAEPLDSLSESLVNSGDPNLVWRGHRLRAEFGSDPKVHFRRMLDALLSSRLLLSSPLSRAAFWGDKRRAIDAYLGSLLANEHPEDIQEAFEVVSRIRSATLIDEILSSTRAFTEAQRATLSELRTQLNVLSEAEGIPPHLRFATRAARVGRAISRRWHEAAQEALSGAVAAVEMESAPRCATLVSVSDGFRVLTERSSLRLPVDRAEVEKRIAAFRFECMEPLVDPKAKPDHCIEALRRLAEICYLPWASDRIDEVCPEDELWSIPWQAFPLLSGRSRELALRLSPRLVKTSSSALANEDVAIWIGANSALPNIQRERELLLDKFPRAIVCETREDVLHKMHGRSLALVHVSAHGRHQEGNPMFSYVEFPDGPLYAAEVTSIDFRVSRAVLLSCESARVSLPFRREPDGLARAFLSRSAEEIVGSSWLLDDDAALDLFSSLYAGDWRKSFAEPLSVARRLLFDKYGHPFYWASPVLIRGYSSTDAGLTGNREESR